MRHPRRDALIALAAVVVLLTLSAVWTHVVRPAVAGAFSASCRVTTWQGEPAYVVTFANTGTGSAIVYSWTAELTGPAGQTGTTTETETVGVEAGHTVWQTINPADAPGSGTFYPTGTCSVLAVDEQPGGTRP